MTLSRQSSAPLAFVRGIVHSTDASAGVEIPFYEEGSLTARVLAADEFLVIEVIHLVTAPGGDSYVHLGASSTLGVGETVLRGTFAATSGVALQEVYAVGMKGSKAYVHAPAGVVDVIFYGQIRKV